MLTERWYAPGEAFAPARIVRTEVFIEEQGYDAALEFDALDAQAYHLVLFDGQEPVAAARLVRLHGNVWKPGRICVRKACRGTHAGAQLMCAILAKGKELGAKEYHIGAQTQAKGFYEKFGFHALEEIYMDGHIPHVEMTRLEDGAYTAPNSAMDL